MPTKAQIDLMRERVTDEVIFGIFKRRTGFLRNAFGWMFRLPTQRFARLFAEADEAVGRAGLPAGGQVVLKNLGVPVISRGEELIPREGPLLVTGNHPGAYDTVAVPSCVPRPDLFISASDTRFYRTLPNTNSRFVYIRTETTERMLALRQAVAHLQAGEALVQFASGKIEPDPEVMPGIERFFERWSPSIELMLRKVPETKLVLAITSGVVLRRFAYHPLTHIHKNDIDQRRMAELMQVLTQLVFPRSVKVHPHVSFAPPVSVAELEAESEGRRLMPAIVARARRLLAEHLAALPV